MAQSATAAMWTVDMAELTGCDKTVWVNVGTILPEGEPVGVALLPEYPVDREMLTLRIRGGMAGHTMYAVPIAPGLTEPWVCPGLLLTDDPGTAAWFASRPGTINAQALDGEDFWRVVHLTHSSAQHLAILPEEHTVWALNADVGSLCRAVGQALAAHEGRWGDWLTVPMTVRGGVGLLGGEGTPHWLRIGADAKLWAMEPWANETPMQGLEALAVVLPEGDGLLRQVTWRDMLLCAAMTMHEDGVFDMERWYGAGICRYLNQWEHTEDILPRVPRCYIGTREAIDAWVPTPADEPLPCFLKAAAAGLLQKLSRPEAGILSERLRQRLEKIAEKNT